MSLDYSEIASDALAAIQEAGTEVTVKRFGRVNDPVVGSVDSAAFIAGTVAILGLQMSTKRVSMMERVCPQALKDNRARMFLGAAVSFPFDLTVNDVFEVDGDNWIVRGVTPLDPGGVILLYTIIAERNATSAGDLAALNIDDLESAVEEFEDLVQDILPPALA